MRRQFNMLSLLPPKSTILKERSVLRANLSSHVSTSPSGHLIVLSLFQSLDELDDDDPMEKERREEEEELVQANTFQNEAMMADPTTGHLMLVSPSPPTLTRIP